MRALIAVLLLVANGAAARECVNGSTEVFEVVSWSAQKTSGLLGEGADVTFEVRNTSETSFRMVQAFIFFDDVLGSEIGVSYLERDAPIAAGATVTQTRSHNGIFGFQRLATINPDDVVVRSCLVSGVTAEGEVVTFD